MSTGLSVSTSSISGRSSVLLLLGNLLIRIRDSAVGGPINSLTPTDENTGNQSVKLSYEG